ncbi:MAG: hypothetical protein M3Y54_18750 [Bacteroidota bacterium]|nr:hypothetical protein [Bacteroidota bacterium]
MFRTLFSCLLLLALAAGASAQTTPVTHTMTAHKKTTVHHPAAKSRTTVRKTSTRKVGATTPAKRSTTAAATSGTSRMGGATGSTANADGQGQGVYAAPGEPVIIQTTPVSGYDGPAAGRHKTTKTSTTLNPR